MSSTVRLFLSLAILASTAASVPAAAQTPRVAVLGFAGPGGATARTQVIRALRGRVDFIPRADAEKLLSKRGLQGTSTAGRAAIGDALGADYLFFGRVKGRGSAARTEIRVAGTDGETLTGYEAGAPGTSRGNALIQEAAQTALEEAKELSPPRRSRRAAAGAAAAAPVTAAAASVPATSSSPKPVPEEKPEKKAKEPKEKKRDRSVSELPVFEIFVGGGVRVRDINFTTGSNNGGPSERAFDSGAYADVGGYFLIRPLGRSEKPALQAIVIQGDGGVGLGLRARLDASGAESDVRTWRVLGQLGYLYPIKKLQVGGLVGAGVDTFNVDLNPALPSIRYVYMRVGGALGYTIISDFLGFRVDGGFRKPFSLGGIDAAFGNDSSAIGWDATATLGGKLDVGFSYAFRFIFETYDLDFAGATENVPARGNICPEGLSCGGTDRAFTYQFLVGWSF